MTDLTPIDPNPVAEPPLKPVGRGQLIVILTVLTLVNIVNVMDRSLLSVLAEPIKHEFGLSDTQIGLLAGLAFAVVYGLVALPISRIADRGLYRSVIMVSLAVWSGLTALGGLSQNFWQLGAMRVGVAAGEAGLNPASHALISRLWSPERRGSAIAVFSLGVPLGAAAGAILAGTVAQAHGWRAAFFVIGPIGMAVLPLLFLLPRFNIAPNVRGPIAWGSAFSLLRHPIYLKVWLACALASMFSFGCNAFAGPFFMRVHGMALSEIGMTLALTAVFGVGAGAFAGGLIFDAVKRRWPGNELFPSAVALVASAGFAVTAWFAPTASLSLIALTAALFCYGLSAVPAMAVGQNLAAPDKRAGASALMGISTGLIGATLGPLVAGLLSDGFHLWAGPAALPYALSALALALLGGGVFYALAGFDLRRKP